MQNAGLKFILFSFLLLLPVSFSEDQPFAGVDTTFGINMPQTSAADPEFVAQEKFTEEVTSVYNWIASNGTEFIQGCKGDRAALVSRLGDVIKNAQETSNVCRQFEEEASSCNPESFCSKFEKGIPFPPEVKIALKQMGRDPETIKPEDFDRSLAMQMCKAMFGKEIGRMKAQQDKMKENLKSQVPKFREGCKKMEEFREKGMQGPQLPTFDIPKEFNQGNYGPQGQGQNYGPPQNNYPAERRTEPYRDECFSPPPQCPGGARSSCTTGRWVCEDPSNYRPPEVRQPENPQIQPLPPQEQQPLPPQEQQVPTTTEQPPAPQPPAPEPIPQAPAVEPLPPAPVQPEQPAQATTSAKKKTIVPAKTTGLEVLRGEQSPPQGPPADGRQFEQGSNYRPPQGQPYGPQGFGDPQERGFGPPQNYGPNGVQEFGQPPGFGPNGFGPQNNDSGPQEQRYDPNRQQGYNQQQNYQNGPQGYQGGLQGGYDQGPRGPGPSPEELCEMTDDELIETFMGGAQNYGPDEKDAEEMCSNEAGKIVKEFAGMKLGIAQCKANAALECAAKKESAKSCEQARQDPAQISENIINSMCRRYGIRADAKQASGGLYDVAKKFYANDPALADQLGDAADKTIEDKQKLNFFSYVFGDPNYGQTLKQRSERLKAIKAKLTDEGDKETITEIENEIAKLDSESSQFNNVLDIGRIGRMFGGN